MEVASIVLAGGRGLRLGRSKALELVGGRPLIQRVIASLRQLPSHIMVVTSREQVNSLRDAGADEVLVDICPGTGPLGGIYTGLVASPCWRNVVVACDMPFLNPGLLRYLVELCQNFDAVVPRLSADTLEPLHAVYSKVCLDSIKSQLGSGRLKVDAFLKAVRVRYVERSECQRLDPQLLSFFNINRQADLERAEALAAKLGI
jgi:molybdopterin-guanine dinucleotide biosynthesis protein A